MADGARVLTVPEAGIWVYTPWSFAWFGALAHQGGPADLLHGSALWHIRAELLTLNFNELRRS
jgi:hypothetical protein